MVFWLATGIAVLVGFVAVKAGFYETLALFFNLWVAVYLGTFLTPFVVGAIPACTEIPYGATFMLLGVTAGTFAALYFAFYLVGQFKVPFPKVLDVAGAWGLGFLAGFLIVSYAIVVLTVIPASGINGQLGKYDVRANRDYVCWWGDRMHGLVGLSSPRDSHEALATLQQALVPPSPATPAPTDPNGSACAPEPGRDSARERPIPTKRIERELASGA